MIRVVFTGRKDLSIIKRKIPNLGIGICTFNKLVRSGQPPRPIEVAPNCHRRSAATVAAWIEKKAREPCMSRTVRGIIAMQAQPKRKIIRIRF